MTHERSLDRLAHRLENWRRHLIDLTRRNRLLNYRRTKVTTIEVVDEVPQQVLRQLMEDEVFKFDPKPEPEDDDLFDAHDEGLAGPVPGADRFRVGQAVIYTEPGNLPGRHRDNRLQTRLPELQLAKNLLNIYRRAKESMEEQGVNTLFLALGMLEWYDAEHSDEGSRAPLLMVPVKLTRRSAASGFVLSSGDDDPILNPAIVEKLRLDFQVDLPEMPEAVEDLDLDLLFRQIETATKGLPRWRLTSDVVLGLFSFQKFIMYRDLGRNEKRLRGHPVVRAICREEEAQPGRVGLPPEIRDAPLDEEMSPWSTVQVLDADSSQQRAMLAVRQGTDLVIEGPPGTGKSQTITNLIADALHDGKTVLFVSEKMAALEVVKNRLESGADLGDYVLELHSNKTAKTSFVKELSRVLDVHRTGELDGAPELSRLRALTEELRKYVVELHRPEPPLADSPYEAIGELVRVENAPFLKASVPDLDETDAITLQKAERRLGELARTLAEVGDPASHPLRGLGLETASRTDARALESAVARAAAALDELTKAAESVAGDLGLQIPETIGDAQVLVEGARVVVRSPGADTSVLENDRWNDMSTDATRLLETGRRYEQRRLAVDDHFRPEVLDTDQTAVIAQYGERLERGAWRVFFPSYWQARKELRRFLRPDHKPSDAAALLEAARTAQLCREDRLWLIEQADLGPELFGTRWNGPGSDWDELQEFADWVIEFRRYALKEILAERGLEVAAAGDLDADEIGPRLSEFEERIRGVREALARLVEAGAFSPRSEIQATPEAKLARLRTRIGEVGANLGDLRTFSQYVAARNACREGLAGGFVERALADGLEPEVLVAAFRRLFYETWLERVFQDRPVLDRFQAGRHEERIAEFQTLDQRSFDLAKGRTHAALVEQRQGLLLSEFGDQLQLLQREARKRRRIMPIRKLLQKAGKAVQRIKPCFMMSPLSVAQYLDPEVLKFDLLVFDEASQIPPPDAIGSIVRARQVVVVGDSRQLPPTNFFSVHLDDAEMEEEELDLLEDLESILDEVATAGVPGLRLKWHYRSEHQSLIRFSNEEFYEDEPLLVFPSAIRSRDDLGLKFEYVEDGIYEGRGRNPVEARRVAQAVVEHIHTRPDLTLGVGTFGIAQQSLILDELDQMRREHPVIEWFFQQSGERKFFVKNLENIQGDDRDVIFLSVTYGPNRDGQVRRNFGPINKRGGWRRLNVLTTRAKQLLRVFSSMLHDQIDTRNINPGAVLLRQYLQYARTGEYPSPKIPEGEPDSPFEVAVMNALKREGYSVVPQVGEAGYRVDIGVVDSDRPGRYICGIECDGASYHSAATVRDRDRLRQQVLETRGWEIHRVWSTDWFHDPSRQVERLAGLIERSRERLQEVEQRTNGQAERAGSAWVPPTPEPEPESEGGPEGSGGSRDESEEDSRPDPAPRQPPSTTPLDRIKIPRYQLAEARRLGASEDFYDCSFQKVQTAVLEVLKTEAPIHLTELARRLAGFWGMQRAGRKIVMRTEQALRTLARNGSVVRNDAFVSLPGLDPVPVRSRDIEGIIFSADHLPPSEVREAVRVLLRHRAPLLRDDVISETARLLGFGRTGRRLQRVIEDALQTLIESGEVRPRGHGLDLVASEEA